MDHPATSLGNPRGLDDSQIEVGRYDLYFVFYSK